MIHFSCDLNGIEKKKLKKLGKNNYPKILGFSGSYLSDMKRKNKYLKKKFEKKMDKENVPKYLDITHFTFVISK